MLEQLVSSGRKLPLAVGTLLESYPVDSFEKYEAWQRRRLDVKPGITCLWQISGRSRIGFDEWMRLDLEYIRRQSLSTDLWILLRTVPAVLSREGAY